MSSYQKRTPERLVEILRSSDQNPRSWNQEAAEVLERLCAEVADLTGANELLHGIVSNREEEISDLRAQLAEEKAKHVLTIQHSDLLGVRLASARKALENVLSYIDGEMIERAVVNTSSMRTLGEVVRHALTDENST